MAEIIRNKGVQPPNISDFLKMSASQEAQKPNCALQMDPKGKLYVSKKHGYVTTFFAKIFLRLGRMFGTCKFEASIGLYNKDRAEQAAAKFTSLVAEGLAKSGNDDIKLTVIIDSPQSYTNLLKSKTEITKPLLNLFNMEVTSKYKLDENFAVKKSLGILGKKYLRTKLHDPDDKKAFMKIYNGIVEEIVLSASEQLNDKKFEAKFIPYLDFLHAILNSPGNARKVLNYNTQVFDCMARMFSSHKEMNSGELASAIMRLCCTHNGFMHQNSGNMGVQPDCPEGKILLRLAVKKGNNDLLSCHNRDDMAIFLRCIVKPGLSEVFHAANDATIKFVALSAGDRANNKLFDQYCERTDKIPVKQFTSTEPWGQLRKIAGELQTARVDIAQKIRKDQQMAGEANASHAKEGVDKYLYTFLSSDDKSH